MYHKNTPRILILCSFDKSLTRFRKDMIHTLIQNGYRVFAAAPEFDPITSNELSRMGAIPIAYSLQRTGLNPWKDLNTLFAIRKIILKNKIDIVFPYTIKPVIYGSLAGQMIGVPVVSLITGLGFTFSRGSWKARFLQKVSENLYRLALRKNRTVIFQNVDDRDLFKERGILSDTQSTQIVDGSGIHLERYPFRPNDNSSKKIVFVFVARLIREKGAELIMKAAIKLKPEFPKAEFHIIGSPDTTPSSISPKELESLQEQGVIIYHGYQKDIASWLAASDVFVLPTYYREGIPRSILEALSIGMPIITTNTPGCKETVENNVNGILIEPRQLDPLISALRYFLENPDAIRPMGMASRKLAEKRFNVDIINHKILEVLNNGLKLER